MTLNLHKLWVASLFAKGQKHPFATPIIMAGSYDEAEEIACEWNLQKHNGRARMIKIEKSKKGEVVAHS